MNYYHKADHAIAKWLDDLTTKEIRKELSISDKKNAQLNQDSEKPNAFNLMKEETEYQDETAAPHSNTSEMPPVSETSAETSTGDSEQIESLKKEVENLKKELQEKKQKEETQNQIDELKKRIDKIEVQDDTNLNDSIYQSAAIKHAQRMLRRIKNKIAQSSTKLTTKQIEIIQQEYLTNTHLSAQELANKISKKVDANHNDIYQFLMNFDHQNRFEID